MLIEASAPLENAGRSSVNGVNETVPALAAALTDFHTPPPAVPTNTVFPVSSEGSAAMLVTLPVTLP
jgi:hypothetical protein